MIDRAVKSFLISSVLVASACLAQGIAIRPVIETGINAPGMSEEFILVDVNAPVIDANGRVAFAGFTNSVGGLKKPGMWAEEAGFIRLIAESTQQAPGLDPGVTYGDLFPVFHLGDNGSIAVTGSLRGPAIGGDSNVIWGGAISGPVLVAQRQTQAPGFALGITYDIFANQGLRMNAFGALAFPAIVKRIAFPSSAESGLFMGSPGSINAVIKEGQSISGLPAGTVFSSSDSVFGFNDLSRIAIGVNLKSQATGAGMGWAVIDGGIGGFSVVAKEGDTAPGVSFPYGNRVDAVANNNAGTIVFRSVYKAGSFNKPGLWTGTTGNIQPAILWAENITGLPNDHLAIDFGLRPLITSSGEIFSSTDIFISGQVSSEAIIAIRPGESARNIVELGQQAPGTPPGTTFATIGESPLDPIAVNGLGQVAFVATIEGDTVNLANDSGIWATLPDGTLTLVIRELDPFPVPTGLTKTARGFHFLTGSAGEDGRRSSFNDSSQLAFIVVIDSNDSAIVVADVVPPPALCLGDANGDGTVNFADITEVLGNWLNNYTPGTGPGDANGDGDVNFGDITSVLSNWLFVCP